MKWGSERNTANLLVTLTLTAPNRAGTLAEAELCSLIDLHHLGTCGVAIESGAETWSAMLSIGGPGVLVYPGQTWF